MRQRQIIRKVEQVRALRTPIRQRVLSALQELGPCSVREVAETLGWKPASLYYHVKQLVDVGLAAEVDQRPAHHRSEAIYEAVAREVEVDPTIRTPTFLDALWDTYRAALRACERWLERALQAEHAGTGPRRDTAVRQWIIRLAPEHVDELRKRIEDLDRFIAENDNAEAADRYALTLVWSRRLDS